MWRRFHRFVNLRYASAYCRLTWPGFGEASVQPFTGISGVHYAHSMRRPVLDTEANLGVAEDHIGLLEANLRTDQPRDLSVPEEAGDVVEKSALFVHDIGLTEQQLILVHETTPFSVRRQSIGSSITARFDKSVCDNTVLNSIPEFADTWNRGYIFWKARSRLCFFPSRRRS